MYIPQKVLIGQTLVDFLVDYPISNDWELTDVLFDEDLMLIKVRPSCKMHIDEARHYGRASWHGVYHFARRYYTILF